MQIFPINFTFPVYCIRVSVCGGLHYSSKEKVSLVWEKYIPAQDGMFILVMFHSEVLNPTGKNVHFIATLHSTWFDNSCFFYHFHSAQDLFFSFLLSTLTFFRWLLSAMVTL